MIAKEADRVETCRRLIQEAEAGEHKVVTSAFTIAELTRRNGQVMHQFRAEIDGFFRNHYFLIFPVDRFVAEKARELVWDFSLKPGDAVQVATAIRSKSTILYTYDGQIIGLNGKVPAIEIQQPTWSGQPKLIE